MYLVEEGELYNKDLETPDPTNPTNWSATTCQVNDFAPQDSARSPALMQAEVQEEIKAKEAKAPNLNTQETK